MTRSPRDVPDDAQQHAGVEAADHVVRSKSPYSFAVKLKRVIWMLVGQPLMRLTFHNWYGVRRGILRAFGAKIDRTARIRSSVRVEQPWNLSIGTNTMVGDNAVLYCLGKVTIGSNCSLSQYAHLCAGTHDYTRPDMPLLTLPITLGDEVWIAADAFVGPGVTIGDGVVVGARSSVHRSLEPWGVYAGNPAKRIKDRAYADAPTVGEEATGG